MPEPKDKINKVEDRIVESDEIEVVAHSEDEELQAGCFFNGKDQL